MPDVQLTIECSDPHRLAAFWADVLHYAVDPPGDGSPDWPTYSATYGSSGEAWAAIADPESKGPRLLFQRVAQRRESPPIRLDIRVADVTVTTPAERKPIVDGEAARLVSIGAVPVTTVDDGVDYFVVLEDPEGNRFHVC